MDRQRRPEARQRCDRHIAYSENEIFHQPKETTMFEPIRADSPDAALAGVLPGWA